MAEYNTDRHPNGGWYLCPTGMAWGLLAALAGGRDQRSPPPVGKCLGVPRTGIRGLQPPYPPWVGSGRARKRALLQVIVEINHLQSLQPKHLSIRKRKRSEYSFPSSPQR